MKMWKWLLNPGKTYLKKSLKKRKPRKRKKRIKK
jgi:hypothetical protein